MARARDTRFDPATMSIALDLVEAHLLLHALDTWDEAMRDGSTSGIHRGARHACEFTRSRVSDLREKVDEVFQALGPAE